MARFRIAYARINQETNCLCPVQTTFDDFQSTHFLEGEVLAGACGPDGYEVPGMFRRVELAGFRAALADGDDAEPVPLFSAWAVASGPLTRPCFDTLNDRLEASLKAAGRVDAVYLALHGAMGVSDLRDPESRFIETATRASGGAPVMVTHDLHANLTEDRVRGALAVISYKTNPHRDHFARGRQAGRLLLRALRGEVKPVTAWRSLPMYLGGGTTLDVLPPMLAVYARLHLAERLGTALAASVNMCHPWNSDPGLGWSTCVTTNGDRDAAERLADALAEMCWARKDALPPVFADARTAIAEAKAARVARKLGAVVLADASDVVTAGASGENTALLRALLEQAPELRSYAPLRAPHTVAKLWPRVEGETVDVTLGGVLDPAHSEPFTVRGRVLHKRDNPGFGRTVVLACEGLHVVLTTGPAITIKPDFFTQAGLDPWKADVLVVKNFFPFRLFFAPLARKTIYVKTRGATDFDAAAGLTFDGPMHPRDVVGDWREADARRRGQVGPSGARVG
jgi:microcystin degradation protein MlrC